MIGSFSPRCLGAVLLCCVTLAPITAFAADGYQLNGIGAIQRGTAGAGVASPQDASWTLLNPAGIARLEARFDMHVEMIRLKVESEPRGIPPLVNPFAGAMSDTVYIPYASGGVVHPLKRGTLAIGAWGTQGNRTDLPRSRVLTGLLGNGDRRSQYEVARVPIIYAHAFENGWSLGAGVQPVAARFRTDSLTLRLFEAQGNHSWDYAAGIGFQFGLLKEWERWSLGASYQSRVWMADFDKYKDDLITSNFDLPQSVQVGLAYRPRENVELLLDYRWIEWEGTAQLSNKSIDGGLGWRNSHIVKAGLTWDVNERWTLRGGVSYGKTPVQAEYAFVNALSPALAEWHFAVGATWRINERHELHAALTHVPRETMRGATGGDIFSLVGVGTKIGYSENAATLQYTYKF